ncbi:MAG: hypothetical protein C0525_02785 [Flavobacterium sp.]|nr:hypothetical protein [Flavobacterium sp.]
MRLKLSCFYSKWFLAPIVPKLREKSFLALFRKALRQAQGDKSGKKIATYSGKLLLNNFIS